MAITITSQKFTNLNYPVLDTGTDYLLGNVGDQIRCITEFYVKWSSENITLILAETTANNTIRRTDSGDFLKDGFRIGNSFSMTGTGADAGNYVISDVTDKLITITGTLSTKTTYFPASIYGTNLLTASDYYYNLIENSASDSFVSLSDYETQQRYTANGITATGTTGTYVVGSNSKAWSVSGNGYGVVIDGLGVSNYKQSFRITQTFIITPIALYSQTQNLEDGMPPAPDWFLDRKCLKHLSRIDMKIDATDPDVVHSVVFSRNGNTGWFGEFMNGGAATYTTAVPSYVYGGVSGFTEIQISSATSTTAAITLTSSNSTFTTGTTAILHIIYLPNDETDYVNTTNTYRQAFIYDRVDLTGGVAAKHGINSGTDQAIIDLSSITYVSPSTMTINASFVMAAATETRLAAKDTDDRNYIIFVTIQSPSITSTKGTDRNTLIVDSNSFGLNLDDSSLVALAPNVKFYNSGGGLLGSEANGYGGDIIRAVAPFTVKTSGSQMLYNVGVRIDAVYTGSTGTFTLEEWDADTSGVCLNDGVQDISISQSRGFRLPSSHLCNKITVDRTSSLDTATRIGYTLSYPFMLRYETWRDLVDPNCAFQNGTQDWSVISNKSGWSIKLYLTATAYDPATDHETDFEVACNVSVTSSAGTSTTGSTGTWGVVTTYDSTNTVNQYGDILIEEDTYVRADFYGNFASIPTGTTGYYAILYLDQGTIGGVNWVYPFASDCDLRKTGDNSPWISATGTTGTCFITLVSATHIQVIAILDHTKLSPSIDNYNLRAKLDYI